MRRWLCLLLLAGLLAAAGAAAARTETARAETVPETPCPPAEYTFSRKVLWSYESDTLIWSVERCTPGGALCFLTKIWVRDPARQIRKATAGWRENIRWPLEIAETLPEAVLATNGSGYVSPSYPGIPDSYPGTSEDYYYTPLGSLTVTDGEIFRNLEGVPYYGLTLEADGLQMYTGADIPDVLTAEPLQTWAFYEQCGMQRGGEDLLPAKKAWPFADRAYRRTVIARVNRNNYLLLHVTREQNAGLSLHQINSFLMKNFDTEWVYNLDGGPSSALIIRKTKDSPLRLLTKKGQRVADLICFTE